MNPNIVTNVPDEVTVTTLEPHGDDILVTNDPNYLVLSPDGTRLYVTHENLAVISVIDTGMHQVSNTFVIPGIAWQAAVTPDGRYLYVTHITIDVITVIETSNGAVVASISVPQDPSQKPGRTLAISPDGQHVYVTHPKADTAVINTATNIVVATIAGGGSDIAVSNDGKYAYIADYRNSSYVFVIATATNGINGRLGHGKHVVVPKDGFQIILSGAGLILFDAETHQITNSFGGGDEDYLATTPDGRYIFFSHKEWPGINGGIRFSHTIDNAFHFKPGGYDHLSSTSKPRGLVATNELLYIANHANHSVSVFRLTTLSKYLVIDRSKENRFGATIIDAPDAASPPSACVIPGSGVQIVAYRDASGSLHELRRGLKDSYTGLAVWTKLTEQANAPLAAYKSKPYVYATRNNAILLFRDGNGTIRSIYWEIGGIIGNDNLTGTAVGAPSAAGDPVGYHVASTDTHHIIYRSENGHLHEMNCIGNAPIVYGGDLTSRTSAPLDTVFDPVAFYTPAGVNIVVFVTNGNNRIASIYWNDNSWGWDDLSGTAGTPPSSSRPIAHYTPHNDTHHIFYIASDKNIWYLFWRGNTPVVGWNLSDLASAPAAVGYKPASVYNQATNSLHVFFRSADEHLHEIWWTPDFGLPIPRHVDLTAVTGAPLATNNQVYLDELSAFYIRRSNAIHVVYRAIDNRIYEIIW